MNFLQQKFRGVGGGGGGADVGLAPNSARGPGQGAVEHGYDDEVDDELDDMVYVPMDGDLGLFQSTLDLEQKIVDREFERKDQTDYVSLAEVEAEMYELKTDMEENEAIVQEIKKNLENLCKNTVKEKGQGQRSKLDAARICQIENRLRKDESIQFDDETRGDAERTADNHENAAAEVKRRMIRTYNKLKKSPEDLNAVLVHNLDDRMQTLRRV
mmetsp:Transcript_54105/g.128850  ORF Transcript_54105/g.128850 Transcript_54105/m.128850 type:complete len:214 (-) Transcript_54105:273-914(-)